MYQRVIDYSLVVRLIVLVPLVTGMNSVEVTRFAWSILVFPIVGRWVIDRFLHVEKFFLFIEVLLGFSSIHRLLSIRSVWGGVLLRRRRGISLLGNEMRGRNLAPTFELRVR